MNVSKNISQRSHIWASFSYERRINNERRQTQMIEHEKNMNYEKNDYSMRNSMITIYFVTSMKNEIAYKTRTRNNSIAMMIESTCFVCFQWYSSHVHAQVLLLSFRNDYMNTTIDLFNHEIRNKDLFIWFIFIENCL
jgi:hypothetical protein